MKACVGVRVGPEQVSNVRLETRREGFDSPWLHRHTHLQFFFNFLDTFNVRRLLGASFSAASPVAILATWSAACVGLLGRL